MTTGQLLFYAGAALLGLTVILLIIFLIKRPKYQPEGAASGPAPTVVPNTPVSLSTEWIICRSFHFGRQ